MLRQSLFAACFSLLATTTFAGDAVVQGSYLKASNPNHEDEFGTDVAISGDRLVVGAQFEDGAAPGVNGDGSSNTRLSAGAAYIFGRDPASGAWSQEAYVKASHPNAWDYFGYAVAVSGDTVVVGAWGDDSDATGVNGDAGNNSLGSSGAAFVFVRDPSTGEWSQEACLKASDTEFNARFGSAVAIDGDTIVVGATQATSPPSGTQPMGAAYVFVRQPGTASWSQQARLAATDPDWNDGFGGAVAVAGDTIVVGANGERSADTGVDGDGTDNSLVSAGAAYVFVRDPSTGTWSHDAYLKASNTSERAYFGYALAISGERILVGATGDSSGATGVNGDDSDTSAEDAGAAYLFERAGPGGVWVQTNYFKASNTAEEDVFGIRVAISGDTIVVSAQNEDSSAAGVDGDQTDNSFGQSGAAYVFTHDAVTDSWSQTAYLKASVPGRQDGFGNAVALSGQDILVAAYRERSAAVGVDGNASDNSMYRAGAAYLYRLADPVATTFCLGDGTGPACPCANDGGAGEGCANSTGGGARLEAAGTSVVANDDLTFVVTGGLPGQTGVLLQGATAIATSFRDGVLCMGVPTERLEALLLDGSGSALSSSSIVTEGHVSPGETRYYQAWYRDPGGVSPCGLGSNLTQGLVVDWQ